MFPTVLVGDRFFVDVTAYSTSQPARGDVVIFRAGTSAFILQRAYQKNWADNMMMQLMVDDLDGWWAHIESLDLSSRFGVAAPRPPTVQPWGLRVAYVQDPSGVLWQAF